jgi:hypothetical protein
MNTRRVGLTGRARRAALQHESRDQTGQAIREKISGGWRFGFWDYAYAAGFFLGPLIRDKLFIRNDLGS